MVTKWLTIMMESEDGSSPSSFPSLTCSNKLHRTNRNTNFLLQPIARTSKFELQTHCPSWVCQSHLGEIIRTNWESCQAHLFNKFCLPDKSYKFICLSTRPVNASPVFGKHLKKMDQRSDLKRAIRPEHPLDSSNFKTPTICDSELAIPKLRYC